MWMKRSKIHDQGCSSTQLNFLRENKLLSMRRMERQRQPVPRYELPTTASMGRRAVTPPLIETQRRLIEGGRMGRACYGLSAVSTGESVGGQRSEKQIQTEDINDQQFLSAALLKCTEQAQLLRPTCSEGDEPPPLPVTAASGDEAGDQLRRTASNFELGKRSAQRRSCHAAVLPCTRQQHLQRHFDDVATSLPRAKRASTAKVQPDNEEPADNGLSRALQLSIPDITDVEQHPQLDQPLSTRSNSSCVTHKSQAISSSPGPEETTTTICQQTIEQERRSTEQQVLLTEPQRLALLEAAQARYNDLIWQYNRLPISMGTLRVRNLKIELENELDRLDGDLNMLTLPKIYIRRDQLQQISSISCC
ncbi:uncharacterized protein LOC132795988 [Drosophila nasuta]|uniref:uncharacterized protein LOC132795988 n=1 Tax=Drosophila nasuta TaxID=42062 RepID=UPI00295F3D8F|nr:uncharacterized protein LOC132795988 [Drosophila nasuta]